MNMDITGMEGQTMAEIDYKELKKGGFMRQIQKNKFSLRIRVIGGQITAEQVRKVSEIAAKYGRRYIHMTARQGIEIPFVDWHDIEPVKRELAQVGLEPGACGPRVRTVTACQGNGICTSGLIETSGLAKELDAKYFARDLPYKFKIGITGCPNNCLKAEENDLGIKGGMLPSWKADSCTFCGLCQAVCPTKAIEVDGASHQVRLASERCIYCGKCVKSCPTGAWTGKNGYVLFFGGMFGSHISIGKKLLPIIFQKERLFRVVDATVRFYKQYGKAGERFRNTLDRVGESRLQDTLLAAGGEEAAE